MQSANSNVFDSLGSKKRSQNRILGFVAKTSLLNASFWGWSDVNVDSESNEGATDSLSLRDADPEGVATWQIHWSWTDAQATVSKENWNKHVCGMVVY